MVYEAFAKKHGIAVSFVEIPVRTDQWEGPSNEGGDWDKHAVHYVVTLERGGECVGFQYSMSRGIRDGVFNRVEDVFESLALDTKASQNPFETWCAEWGFSEYSRKAEYLYNQCRINAAKLKRLLGFEAFQEFLAIEPQ